MRTHIRKRKLVTVVSIQEDLAAVRRDQGGIPTFIFWIGKLDAFQSVSSVLITMLCLATYVIFLDSPGPSLSGPGKLTSGTMFLGTRSEKMLIPQVSKLATYGF